MTVSNEQKSNLQKQIVQQNFQFFQQTLACPMLDSNSKPKTTIPSCSICKYEYDSYYRIPRVIPKCGHTFCQKCINSSVQVRANRKMFVCNECNSETVIRKGAAEDVPKNIGVLDIVKNMKKLQFQQMSPLHNKSPSRDSPAKVKQYCKQHTNKQLDLVCETCHFQKVCSICALIGNSHQDHKFVQYIPASKFDLNQVNQVFTIIEDTVKQTILPHADENIIKRNQQNLIKMLTASVKDHFRQHYHKVIQRKENQVISQLREIKFDGGISKKIQEIAKHYDLLKIQYANMFAQKGNKQNTSLQVVQEFIQKCKDLHNQVETFSQHAESKSKQLFKDLSTKINQSTFLRITQLPFSLKQLVAEKQQVMTSPVKNKAETVNNIQQAKKKNLQFGSKYSARGEKSNEKSQNQFKSVENISFQAQRKPFTANSINTKNKSGFMPPKHKINKIETRTQKGDESMIPTLDLDSKVSEKKTTKPSYNTERLNKSSFQTLKQQKRSVEKQKGSNLNLSRIQAMHEEYSSNNADHPLKMKQVRPLKEVPLALKSKFSAITKEIIRQADGQSLQLIGMQINDQLIVYVCDYLKGKKLTFSMIKLVKNNLTDEGLSILLGYLQNNDCTQVLNLTSNQLSSRCLQLLIEFAQKNSFLKTIYLSHNKISGPAVKQKASHFQNLGMNLII